MSQVFMIVLREGVEAFLIVAITFSYLRKTRQWALAGAVRWGVLVSAGASTLLGYFLWIDQGASQPLWEGIFGAVTVVLVLSLVVHMQKVGPRLSRDMENHLSRVTASPAKSSAYWGVFLFTVFMVSREGMEMTLMLFQLRDADIVKGVLLGTLAAGAIALLWQQFGYYVNMKTFFKITSVFLVLFVVQVAAQAFHELTEAGIFPNSQMLHEASEAFSAKGVYGKLYGNIIFFGCAGWLLAALVRDKLKPVSVNRAASTVN